MIEWLRTIETPFYVAEPPSLKAAFQEGKESLRRVIISELERRTIATGVLHIGETYIGTEIDWDELVKSKEKKSLNHSRILILKGD